MADKYHEAITERGFPIVGIGASAGGLEALTSLLEHLPTDTGLSFIIIQHMATGQESMLTSILSRSTKMPVTTVENGMIVKQDQVFVIPPGKIMTLADGHLELVPKAASLKPIDAFFNSLAKEKGMQAIGIVLSGTGTDGTEGLKEIKNQGGVTFAQNPKTAQYPGMPLSAISSEIADFILSPDEIAQELLEIANNPQLVRAKMETVKDAKEAGLEPLLALLKSNFRVDFSNYKETFLNRRIARRLVISHQNGYRDYFAYLRKNSNELQALFEDLLVGVTSFFREPKTFTRLKEEVFPELVKNNPIEQSIRVWIPGCSSGEEAYSFAIVLLEFLEEKTITNIPIQIFGTDVNEKNIEKARQGMYAKNIESSVSEERLKKFFNRVNGNYQIAKSVRDKCIFAKQDIASDPPFSKLDLISCRNMLIYFDSQLQERIVPIFHYALKSNGFLVLGESESVGKFDALFEPLSKKGIIYKKKESPSQANFGLDVTVFPKNKEKIVVSEKRDSTAIIKEKIDELLLSNYVPASLLINSNLDMIMIRGNVSPYLELESGVASLSMTKVIRKELRSEIQALVFRAKHENKLVRDEAVCIEHQGRPLTLNIQVTPLKLLPYEAPFFLILFEDVSSTAAHLKQSIALASTPEGKESIKDRQILELSKELDSSKHSMQQVIEEREATNEELKTAMEEIQSSNEELQSTNEELETAKEELQSSNEELTTLNDELKSRNQELTRLNYDLDNVSRNTDSAIVIVDNGLKIKLFTPSAEKILKIIPSEMGLPITSVKLGVTAENMETKLHQVISGDLILSEEVRNEEGRWYEMRIRPYLTGNDKVDGAVLTFVDVDEMKKTEIEIRSEKEKFKTPTENSADVIARFDANLRNVYANNAFRELAGKSSEQLAGKTLDEIGLPEKLSKALNSVISDALQTSEKKEGEFDFTTSKEAKAYQYVIVPEFSADGPVESIMCILRDMTESRNREAQFLRVQRLESLGTLAGSIAHDMNNILTPMMLALSKLETRLPKEEDRTLIRMILKEAKRGADLSKQVLTFAKGVQGDRKPIQLADLISDLELTLKQTFSKSINILTEVAPGISLVMGDASQLQQVLMNLSLNARDAMPYGGKLSIKAENITVDEANATQNIQARSGRYVVVSITDTGTGIPLELREKLFQPFLTTKNQGEGTGLGLSTAKSIVKSHGGFIDFDTAVGKGTTFRIYLPALESMKPDEEKKDAAILKGTGQTILIVDDEEAIRITIAAVLEENGYNTLKANDGAEAIVKFMQHKNEVKVVLADRSMPIMDGEATIKALREIDPKIRIILMSGLIDADKYSQILNSVNAIMAKPFDKDKLLSTVSDVLAELPSTH